MLDEKRKGKAVITPTQPESASETSSTQPNVTEEEPEEEEILTKPLVVVLWAAKAGQKRPVGSYSLETIDMFRMTYSEFIVRLCQVLSSKHPKDTKDATIRFAAKACKSAAKATELPKGFPKCLDFVDIDSDEGYESFRELVELNCEQMKSGAPVIQLLGTIAPKPVIEEEETVATERSASDEDDDPGRKVCPFRFKTDSDCDEIAFGRSAQCRQDL